ncbi:MAG: ABC transporter permease [Gammaproteobacteria bacterium]|nr:ABC transporter permease [Gammaproteobacteria bacterium]
MFGYIVRRVLATIPTMLVVALAVFFLMRIGPGDPAALLAGDDASSVEIEQIRAQLGLDRPMVVQFVDWMGNLLQGDMGNSVFNGTPVLELILQRVEPTVAVAVATIVFAISLAIPLGILAAWKAGTWLDRAIMGFAVVSFSLPVFLIAYLFVFGFSLELRWLPVQGYRPIQEGFVPFIRHLILPSLALGLVYTALLARMTRSTMLEVLNEDYVRTARAKGVGIFWVLIAHALQNAAIPIVTTIGVGIASLIGGVVVTESVFAIPGIGRLTIDAVLHRDYPVIQGVIILTALAYVLINLVIDLSYTLLDPRIRY